MKLKKLSLIMCIVFLLSAFSACSDRKENEQPIQWSKYNPSGFTVYKDGVFFTDKNNVLHYFDASSKENVILCDKKDCQHSDSSCHGYVGSSFQYSISGGKIYRILSDDIYSTLQESDIDYTNHREIAALGKELAENGDYVFPSNFRVSGDYLYYSAEVSNFDNGDSYYGIYGINIKNGKTTVIVDRKKNSSDLGIVSVCGKEIIYYTTYLDEALSNELYGQNQEEIDWEVFSEKFKEYEEQRTYSTYKYNMETGETTAFYKDRAAAIPVFANEDYLYGYTFTVDDNLNFVPNKYFTIDQKTQEEKNINKDEFEKNQRSFSESEADAITGGSEDLNIYCMVDSGYIGIRTDKKEITGENSYTITGQSYVFIDKSDPQSEPFVFYTWEEQ